MMKFLAIFAAILVVGTTFASAQTAAPSITAPFYKTGDAAIDGTLIAMAQHFDQANIIRGFVTPYVFTSAQVVATTGQLLLIKLATGASTYNMVYNFTAAESTMIRTWLAAQPARNNLHVAFPGTWSSNRLVVTTSTWKFAAQSLFPYSETATCNATAALLCLGALQASIPFDCVAAGVPALKKCVVAHADCLIHSAKGLDLVNTLCTTNRQTIDTLFCSDGRVGGDAVCDYVKCTMPNGKPAAAVTTVGANGIPTAGSACAGGGSSAGSVLFGAAVALVGIVAAML